MTVAPTKMLRNITNTTLRKFSILVSACAAALVFGFAASTANPIVIGATAAGIAGLALLSRPAWIVWLVLLTGLFFVGLVPLWADRSANKVVWGVSILGFYLLLAALIQLAVQNRAPKTTPRFVWLTLIYIIYVAVNGIFQSASAEEFIGGFKRYFSMYGIIFCLAWITFDEEQIARWRKLLTIVATFQLPIAFYQLIVLVPLREKYAYAYPSMVPIDVVAGTFGSSLTGGGASGEMVAFLTIFLAFLITRGRAEIIKTSRLAWMIPIVLAPLLMGETKIVLIILPLILFWIYFRDIVNNPAKIIIVLCLCFGAVAVLTLIYVIRFGGSTIHDTVSNVIASNFGDIGYGDSRLNRTTVLTFWLGKQGLSDPLSIVFGNGVGAALDSTANPGYIARRYYGMGIGLTAASMLLWEQGLLGLLMFVAVLAGAWRTAYLLARSSETIWIRADAWAIVATIPVFVVWVFYRSSLLDLVTFQIVFALVLGYLAWLCRRNDEACFERDRH